MSNPHKLAMFEVGPGNLIVADAERRFAVRVEFNGRRSMDGGGTGLAKADVVDLWGAGRNAVVVEEIGTGNDAILASLSRMVGGRFGFARVDEERAGRRIPLGVEMSGWGILLSEAGGREVASMEFWAGAERHGEVRARVSSDSAPLEHRSMIWGQTMRFLRRHGIVETHDRKPNLFEKSSDATADAAA